MTIIRWLVLSAALILTGGGASAQTPSLSPDKHGTDLVRTTAPDWDLNHDGIYTCEEWKIHVTTLFNKADRNHDGYLTADEFATIKRAEPLFADADMGYFDDNKDGRISRSEFIDKPSPFFQRFDLNHDCRVTPDELAGKKPPEKKPVPGTGERPRF